MILGLPVRREDKALGNTQLEVVGHHGVLQLTADRYAVQ